MNIVNTRGHLYYSPHMGRVQGTHYPVTHLSAGVGDWGWDYSYVLLITYIDIKNSSIISQPVELWHPQREKGCDESEGIGKLVINHKKKRKRAAGKILSKGSPSPHWRREKFLSIFIFRKVRTPIIFRRKSFSIF